MIQRNKIVKNEAQNYALENKRRKEENIHRELHYQTDLQKERKRLCPKSTELFQGQRWKGGVDHGWQFNRRPGEE